VDGVGLGRYLGAMFKPCLAPSLLSLVLLQAASPARAEEPSSSRYPFDPVCSWGRLANGKGMIVRCLTEKEAAQLTLSQPAAPAAATSANAVVESPPPTKKSTEALDADVVSVTADQGTLPTARKNLRVPKEQYARCVADNGGLSADAGEVSIRFLVRERGRAEGASVEKKQGLNDAAARCIAAVVDRRPVGTPEGPDVGATVVIRISKQVKH
jgi:hypothetical protein